MEHDVDLLVVSAHPDDAEIGMGGTIARYAAEGRTVASLCLTRAALSSNGDPYLRQVEKERAGELLGITTYVQLDIPDRGIVRNEGAIADVVRTIRALKPRYVFSPHSDRHPDHGAATELVREAVFNARIRRYMPEMEPHAVYQHFLYCINGVHQPDFYVNVSDFVADKQAALTAYASQFTSQGEGQVHTPLSDDYIAVV
ncbi:MAG: bacillithiol biosynthesis deacetylase BshB1, partial [Bacilli bacterium]